jgi:hypothetical protein
MNFASCLRMTSVTASHGASALALGCTLTSILSHANTPTRLMVDADNALVVEYEAEPGKSTLPFTDGEPGTHTIVRSAFWKSKDTCAKIEPMQIVFAEGCKKARFELTWDAVSRDRIYPAVVNFANGGRLIFLRNLHVLKGNHLANIELIAPKGGVAQFAGAKSATKLSITDAAFAQDKRGWAYLGPDKFAATDVADILIDDGVPSALSKAIVESTPKLLAFYERALAARPVRRASIYVHWDNRDARGASSQADTVPGAIIRFGLSGKGWAEADAQKIGQLQHIAAHELAHLWNAGAFQSTQQELSWLHEGNAELLASAATLALQIAGSKSIAVKFERALSECLATAGSRAWRAMDERQAGHTPYTCGLMIQFAIAAHAQQKNRTVHAAEWFRRYWKTYPQYNERNLLAFFAAQVNAEAAGQLQCLLYDEKTPFDAGLRELFASAGLTLAAGPERALAAPAFSALMRADCGGVAGFTAWEDHLVVEKIASCKTFKGGEKIRNVEGHLLFSASRTAAQALKAKCLAGKPVRLQTTENVEFDVPCARDAVENLAVSVPMTKFDPSQIAAILGDP